MLPRLLSQHRRRFHALAIAGVIGAACFGSFATAPAAARVRASAAVTGGHLASSGWPWAAALVNSWMPAGHDYSRAFCGGTLIAPDAVVTAAHCVRHGTTPDDIHVVVGRDDLTQANEADASDVVDIVIHPANDPTTDASDVAVLRLARAADGPPAPLARAGDWARSATAAGWGDTVAGSGEGSDVLRELDLRLQTDRACESWWDDAYDPRTMLCAEGAGGDMCEGDSGSPIMVADRQGNWRLLGVTSFGDMQCGDSGTPGVFAWVAGPALRGWVLDQADAVPELPPMERPARNAKSARRPMSARRSHSRARRSHSRPRRSHSRPRHSHSRPRHSHSRPRP